MIPEPLLELRGITKNFSGVVALQDVDLAIDRGRILALVGENGAGKSTLMKILSGVHSPDAGIIRCEGREVRFRGAADAQALGISIIYQEFSLVPYLDVVENIFLGRERRNRFGACCRNEMHRLAQEVMDRLGAHVPLDARVAQLSVAEQQVVEIAKALLRETRVLIMDEPTATLTASETAGLFRVMRELRDRGVAIVFISHHLDEVLAIADRIVCLRDGRVAGAGPVESFSHDSLIRMMVGRDIAFTYPPKASGPRVSGGLEVRRLQRKPNLPEVAFTARPGEILGIAGLVGSGRTKMIRALLGVDRAHRHEVWFRGRPLKLRRPADARRAGIGFVPEDRKQQGLILGETATYNIVLPNLRKVSHAVWRCVDQRAAERAAGEHLRTLDVKNMSPHLSVRRLSGGNQQKIVLAKWLFAGCDVLVLDEPTRGVDVGAKAEIYRLLRDLASRGFTIIVISSELPEVLGLSDCVLVMRRQGVARFFDRGEPVTAEAVMACATVTSDE